MNTDPSSVGCERAFGRDRVRLAKRCCDVNTHRVTSPVNDEPKRSERFRRIGDLEDLASVADNDN